MIEPLEPVLTFLAPASNALVLLAAALAMPPLARRMPPRIQPAVVLFLAMLCFLLYHGFCHWPLAERWLRALESPVCLAVLLVILPALHLKDRRYRRLFLAVPALFLLAMAWGIAESYAGLRASPAAIRWPLVRPAWLVCGLTSALVLLQPLMPLRVFRPAVRLTCFLVLIYGGFALRQNPTDYRDMLGRRKTQAAVMNLSETAPVMRYDDRMVHLPSAPCRFAPDGGYVQGCNMELAQRFLQIDFRRVQRGDPSEVNAMGSILASTLVFLVLAIVLSRAACGWLCPLSSMGELFNFIRRRTGRSPIRPSPRVRNAYLYSGLGLSGLGLAMSALYPYIDANGNFLGCKIPLYPFCKLCPSQQLCPVAGSGPAGYPPLPGLEWAFGLFRYGCLVLLALFVVSTLAGRRLWCRFCPMGMISGVFNRGGLFALRKQPEKCNRCGMCAEVCPMDIRRVRDERSGTHVSSYDCVLCLQCIDACPRDRCLSLEHHGITIVESRYRGLP